MEERNETYLSDWLADKITDEQLQKVYDVVEKALEIV